ncbi:unnamed protein product [Orchesella dallaii]|uniref:Uncharacterized protein n=1 Tax=Orchesella dallaii TaxID=48710 RepID=A0ABP1R6S5_9HEXA
MLRLIISSHTACAPSVNSKPKLTHDVELLTYLHFSALLALILIRLYNESFTRAYLENKGYHHHQCMYLLEQPSAKTEVQNVNEAVDFAITDSIVGFRMLNVPNFKLSNFYADTYFHLQLTSLMWIKIQPEGLKTFSCIKRCGNFMMLFLFLY